MACYYPEDVGNFVVSPMLMTPCYPIKCCEDPPMCYPCLPRCSPTKVVYCCEKKPSKNSSFHHERDCCEPQRKSRPHSPPKSCKHPPSGITDTCATSKPVKTKYVIPCYRYEDGRIEQYVPTRHGRLPVSAYRRNGMQDQIHGYRGAIRYICAGQGPQYCCVYTAIEPMRRFYSKVRKLPVSAFKRNGIQDQEHSKTHGSTNFLFRCPRDVVVECEMNTNLVKVGDPAKVPPCTPNYTLGCCLLRKKPIEVSLEDILDD